ncbi:NYN domain-containing protein [Calothrix sp. NIES-2098]|uniref:NYN domain-containing protein n=1 Tax=Calothrix sp. NIES-2098 TaxID=1954171 RepID=UPI000BBCDDE9
MPHEESLLTNQDNLPINTIASYVCQAIISIQEQQPELLNEKFKHIQWRSNTIEPKLAEILSQTPDYNALIQKLNIHLKNWLIPEAFKSQILIDLLHKVNQLNPQKNYLDNTANFKYVESSETFMSADNVVALQQTGIAILLLDAENLIINHESEQFLTQVCHFPLQVKIAFANWRSISKKIDVELHNRGYDLIHVPAGRDHADGKMIAFGSSIHERYPNAKEVFVCSSDTVMTNLCNHIQQNGLLVYRVSKQGETVTVFNSSTGKTIINIPVLPAKISSIEKFILELKILIKKEQINSQNFWIKLSRLSEIFKNEYKITISQVVSKYLPGKKARDIFINYPADFVIHQIDPTSELYVTLLEVNQSQPIDNNNQAHGSSIPESSLLNINTKADLEQALQNLIKSLNQKSSDSYVNAGILASEFNKKYSKPITQQMKSLQITGTYIKFLQSSSCFTLRQTDKGWEVKNS